MTEILSFFSIRHRNFISFFFFFFSLLSSLSLSSFYWEKKNKKEAKMTKMRGKEKKRIYKK